VIAIQRFDFMQWAIAASPVQARQTKERFAKPEDQLSYELGKAVQELPPLYTRLLALSIGLLVLGAIAWAHFSMVDEVAVASGELIASTQVRPVRALGGGNIRAIKVKEGDRIVKGQVLIERNPDLPQAEVDRLAKSSQLIQRRLKMPRSGTYRRVKLPSTNLQDQLIISRLKDFEARQAVSDSRSKSSNCRH
jgi:HlyD family secretion protein